MAPDVPNIAAIHKGNEQISNFSFIQRSIRRYSIRIPWSASVLVLHATVFANCQPLASGLQVYMANLLLFARFKAFCGSLMGSRNGAVARNIFLGILVAVHRSGHGGGHEQ
jgi:hypothetical protein